MGLAAYENIGNDAEWRARHGGKAEKRLRDQGSPGRGRFSCVTAGTRSPDLRSRTGTCQRVSRELGRPDARIWHTR